MVLIMDVPLVESKNVALSKTIGVLYASHPNL